MRFSRKNIRFLRGALVGALCVGGGLVLATAPAVAAPPSSAPSSSILSASARTPEPDGPRLIGLVTDSAGKPIANAEVVIPELNRSTSTDASGRFAFGQLSAGTYQVAAMAFGYAPARRSVTASAGQDSVRIEFVMRRTAVNLEAVHVTGSLSAGDVRDVTQSTVQLSGVPLMKNLGTNVAQTLETQPGLAMRYNGPAATTPVIRGLTGDRVLVLQNGERAGDLSSAAPDHALTIDPLAAQRIEVVRGPASLLYGSNAIGGVVNVISDGIPTSLPSRLEGFAATQAESGSPGAAISAGVTMPLAGPFALTARGNARSSSNTRQGGGDELLNSFVRQSGGMIGLGAVGARATGGISYEGSRFNYGLPALADDEEFGAHIRGHRQQATGRTDIQLRDAGVTRVLVDATAQWYGHDEVENTGDIGTSFSLKTQTMNATARTVLGPVIGAFGVSGLFKQYAATGEEALTPAANSKSGGLFVFQDLPLAWGGAESHARTPHLHVGARYDLYDIDSKPTDPKFGAPRSLRFNSASGSVGLVVPVSDMISLNGSVSRAFRAPTVEELFSNAYHAAAGTYDVGNPDLKAETNNGAEIVLRAQGDRVHAQLSGYYNKINNYVTVDIVGDTLTDEGETVPLNRYAQADATLKGAEGSIEGEVARHIVLGAMGDLVRGTLRGGDPLPFMPAARLGASARYDNGVMSAGAEYRHGFRQDRVPTGASLEDPSAIVSEAYNVVNLSAGYILGAGGVSNSIVLRVDNVFDAKYRDATSRIKGFAFNPGRNVSLVYKVLF